MIVPAAPPKYSTLLPAFICIVSTPPRIAAQSLDRNGFHTRYSIFVVVPSSFAGPSTLMRFSP